MDQIVVQILVLVFSIVVHEVAHGWVAWRLGDSTARDAGRLTLNPLPHIDPFGSVVLPVVLSLAGGVVLGWAKPVPVHPGRLRNPRDDHPRVAAAGPLSNLLLALISAVGLGATFAIGGVPDWSGGTTADGGALQLFLVTLFRAGIVVNVVLACFNLLPLPPLDGSWILQRFLPPEAGIRYHELRRYGLLLVLGFLILARYTALGGLLHAGLVAVVHPFFALAMRIAAV